MKHRVTIDNTGETFACPDDVHVLAAMEQACCHGIPVGCRNGGCGACKVLITEGCFSTRKMNRSVISAAEESKGCVLACRTFPKGDIVVRALGRVWQTSGPPVIAPFSFGFAVTTRISQPDRET